MAPRTLSIHLSTARRRRHRFRALPKTVQPQVLTGIAEADETILLLSSFKGKRSGLTRKAPKRGLSQEMVSVLVARDRAVVTMVCVLKTMDMTTLSAAVNLFVGTEVMLCTGGSKARACASREYGRRASRRQPVCQHPRRWRLARAKRKRVSQPTQSLGAKVSGRGHVLLGQLHGLVPRARPRTGRRHETRLVARYSVRNDGLAPRFANAVNCYTLSCLRRRAAAKPIKPIPNKASEAGSGTELPGSVMLPPVPPIIIASPVALLVPSVGMGEKPLKRLW